VTTSLEFHQDLWCKKTKRVSVNAAVGGCRLIRLPVVYSASYGLRSSVCGLWVFLPPPRRICNRRCLSVCLLATLLKNLQEIFRKGWQWASEQTVKFWWRSRIADPDCDTGKTWLGGGMHCSSAYSSSLNLIHLTSVNDVFLRSRDVSTV